MTKPLLADAEMHLASECVTIALHYAARMDDAAQAAKLREFANRMSVGVTLAADPYGFDKATRAAIARKLRQEIEMVDTSPYAAEWRQHVRGDA